MLLLLAAMLLLYAPFFAAHVLQFLAGDSPRSHSHSTPLHIAAQVSLCISGYVLTELPNWENICMLGQWGHAVTTSNGWAIKTATITAGID
jgi:hypothetical protein